MSPLAIGATVGVGAAIALGLSSNAEASQSPAVDYNLPSTDELFPVYNDTANMSTNPMPTLVNSPDANLQAFLSVIRKAESNNDYYALVGGGRFDSLSCHPSFTDATMRTKSAYGLGPGWRNSHAAGAYQFQPATWRDCVAGLRMNGDFSRESQDKGAVFLIKRRGALENVLAGDVQGAIIKLQAEWQFLTVPAWPASRVSSTYADFGGSFA